MATPGQQLDRLSDLLRRRNAAALALRQAEAEVAACLAALHYRVRDGERRRDESRAPLPSVTSLPPRIRKHVEAGS